MNLMPSEKGLIIKNSSKSWFIDNHIHFKYRLSGRKVTLPWIYGIARSIFLIERIYEHDWLRRRAGELRHFSRGRASRIRNIMKELLFSKEEFREVKTPDLQLTPEYY